MAAADSRGSGRFAGADLGRRIAVAVPLLALALAAIWAGGLAFAALVAVGVALVIQEWLAMQRVPTPWRYWSALGLVLVVTFAAMGNPLNALLFLLAIMILAVTFAALMRAPYAAGLAGGLLYAGVPGVALVFLRGLLPGFDLVLWVMGLVWATDICAFIAGRSIGGAKIWPAISPGKTWAGLVGGMAGAALFTFALALWRDWPGAISVLVPVAVLLAAVAQAGDFFESWLKRRAGVKDSGTILPGHGGVMDRVDGLLPVAVVVALVMALAVRWPQLDNILGFAGAVTGGALV